MAYRYMTVDYPFPNAGALSSTVLTGINNLGQFSGTYSWTAGATTGSSAFIDSHGQFTSLPQQPGTTIESGKINDHGQAVGTELSPASETDILFGRPQPATAFVYKDGQLTYVTLPPVPGSVLHSEGHGINDAGAIVGNYIELRPSQATDAHGYVSGNGQATAVDGNPALGATIPEDINNSNQIAGTYDAGSGPKHGFLDTGGQFATIDVPGSTSTQALGLNDLGQVVGAYLDPAGHEHGFIDTNGSFVSLDVPGASGTVVQGINDLDEIVGGYTDASGQSHGFVAASDLVVALAGQANALGELLPAWLRNASPEPAAQAFASGQPLLSALPGLLLTQDLTAAVPIAPH